ncbi:hypothetical protein KUCAC02_011107, partial [Chaenocephalus aceratus]
YGEAGSSSSDDFDEPSVKLFLATVGCWENVHGEVEGDNPAASDISTRTADANNSERPYGADRFLNACSSSSLTSPTCGAEQ